MKYRVCQSCGSAVGYIKYDGVLLCEECYTHIKMLRNQINNVED